MVVIVGGCAPKPFDREPMKFTSTSRGGRTYRDRGCSI